MTSPQPSSPRTRITAGTGVEEETLLLPLTTPGGQAGGHARTVPSPYPQRPPFQRPATVPPPAPRPQLWEGTGFRPDIQGLRAIAVVLVLLGHAGLAVFSGGYVGVDVFFVVSGFLITSLLIKEAFDTGEISLAGFFARRARRILPAASAVTVATVVGAWLWFPITRFEAVMQDAFTVIIYVVNYRFVAESTEYLNADAMPSPFQQYWSLAVEEQFYLLWPLLLLCLLLMVKRVPRKALHAAVALAVVVFVLSLIASVLVTESSQPTAYYATHTRAWELAGGAFLALTLQAWKRIPGALALVFGIVGLAAVVASALLFDEATPFPGYAALLPVLGTMLVIVAGTARSKNLASSLLGTAPFQFIGKISYSLYLWHWPILILAPLALGVESSTALNIMLLAGTFAVAQISYEYIETPMRTAKFLKGNVMGLATGVLCSLLGIAMILTLALGFPRGPSGSGPVDLGSVEQTENMSELAVKLEAGLAVDAVPDDLTPSLIDSATDRPVTYANECHVGFDVVALPDNCVYGDADSDIDVVLFGDSHAAQWFPAIESIASEQGWRLLSRTKSSCTPVSVRVESTQHEGEFVECWDWKRAVFAEMDANQPDLVIIGSEDATTLSGVGEGEDREAWRQGWDSTLERVNAAAGTVAMLTDTPRSTTDTSSPDCLSTHMDSPGDCLRDHGYGISSSERRAAGVEANRAAGSEIIDTNPWLCVEAGCPMIVDGLLVYRDTHHITTAYAQSVAPLLAESLLQIDLQ